MPSLSDLIPATTKQPSFLRARVISISGRKLTVDIGGAVVIDSLDSCNPKPDQQVLILDEGTSMLAVGAIAGPYRQATMTVVSNQTDTVTGLVNGVSKAVGKAWAFTATAGDVLPLLWSPDGSNVTALGLPGAAYIPPSGGGGGGTNPGGGGTTTYTSYYPPTLSGTMYGSTATNGTVVLGSGKTGFYSYGKNRMNELQGRALVSARINLLRVIGSGNVNIQSVKGTMQSALSSVGTGGWVSLPLIRASELIAGTGETQIFVYGSGQLKGAPGGAIEITWRG